MMTADTAALAAPPAEERPTFGRPAGVESTTDVRLVEAARGGDRAAFARLHDRYAPIVHAILLGRVKPGEAEDLAQDVFVSAMLKLDALRDPAAFGGWLAQIARNRARDHWRSARATAPLPDAAGADDPPQAEAAEALAALRELPEAYRETLAMRLVEGLSGPEIAERTGMTHASVRVNLHRGMRLLRERLGAEIET